MTEEPLKQSDAMLLGRNNKWRWLTLGLGTAVILIWRPIGLERLAPFIAGLLVVGGGVATLSARILVGRGYCPQWLVYGYCLVDVILVGSLVVYFGPGGAISLFFLTVVPWALGTRHTLGAFALGSSSAAFLLSTLLHGHFSSRYAGSETNTMNLAAVASLELAIFLAVASALVVINWRLFARLSAVQAAFESVGKGTPRKAKPLEHHDYSSRLEQSLNSVSALIASISADLRDEAQEATAIHDSVALSAGSLLGRVRGLVSSAQALDQEIREYHTTAQAVHAESEAAVQEAVVLQSRAEEYEGNAPGIVEIVSGSGHTAAATLEQVLEVGADIRSAADKVEQLGDIARRIGSSAISISKVARHTHVLALNAAIEAARAKEHGREFAVVADQVRSLAGEAARSARDIADLINDLHDAIAATARTMAAGEGKVNEIGIAVGELRNAVEDLNSLTTRDPDDVSPMTETAEAHANRVRQLSTKLSRLASSGDRCTTHINDALSDMETQFSLATEIERDGLRLAQLADRLRTAALLPERARHEAPQHGATSE